jgi:amino-acid N-acetyltransferase
MPDTILRKATLGDIQPIATLVNHYASAGQMLPRTEFELAEAIRDFTIAEADGRLVGCVALRIYTPEAGEVRSLAVQADGSRRGIGRRLVESVEEEARRFGLAELFAFTYVPGFFGRLGYTEVGREALPQKAWKDCLRCPKFRACDEIAVRKQLQSLQIFQENTRIIGDSIFPIFPSTDSISVPIPGPPKS